MTGDTVNWKWPLKWCPTCKTRVLSVVTHQHSSSVTTIAWCNYFVCLVFCRVCVRWNCALIICSQSFCTTTFNQSEQNSCRYVCWVT